MKKYIDRRGWKYRVMPGITQNTFKARFQNADHEGSVGWKGVPTLPWRQTAEEAQADLDALAAKKGWSVWEAQADGGGEHPI